MTLTRILFRSGDSEYAINGVPCRLLDVQELLSDAGVGRQQHVIVSQGQIDAVLNARPEERRAIIEEAAGVLKYRKRKEKAERRLDATEANLLRVQDLLREVRRQLRPLERQAEAARRHGELVLELGQLRVFVAGREIAVAAPQTRIDRRRPDRGVRGGDASSSRRWPGSTPRSCRTRRELSARGESDVSDRLVHVEQLRERARGLAAILAERKRSLERDHGQLLDAGVVANLEADAARLRDELGEVEAALDLVAPESELLAAEDEAFVTERGRFKESLPAAGDAGARAATAAAEVRGELRSLRNAVERSESELRRVTTSSDAVRGRLDQLAAEADRLRADCASAAVGARPRSSPRSSRRRRAASRRGWPSSVATRAAPRRVGGGVARRRPRRSPAAGARRRSRPRRRRATRRCRWRAGHAARPGRDRRRLGAGSRGRARRGAHGGGRRRRRLGAPGARRAARLGHQWRRAGDSGTRGVAPAPAAGRITGAALTSGLDALACQACSTR